MADVLLSPRLAKATRDLFLADRAAMGVVYDLALDDRDFYRTARVDGRYAAVIRAPGDRGDFLVIGAYWSDDAANLAMTNYRALTDTGKANLRTGRRMSYVPRDPTRDPLDRPDGFRRRDDDDRAYSGRASADAYGVDLD